MEKLIDFRETLLFYRDPANGKRDPRRMNGNTGPGPLVIPSPSLRSRVNFARNLGLSIEAPHVILSEAYPGPRSLRLTG